MDQPIVLRKRQLPPPREMTGKERRLIDPARGWVKLLERNADILISRFLYPYLASFWNPYCWLLENRFSVAEISVTPVGWPKGIEQLKILLLTDIHAGIFLKPETLNSIASRLMQLKPDLVAIAGDIVSGHSEDLDPFVETLAPLSDAPLGAWYCYGNHDYFGGKPEEIKKQLDTVGIKTLKNESTLIRHGNGTFILGGIDDLILGIPDWERLLSTHGRPHLLLAHNPDHFSEAALCGIPLTLSGHTHGGQIRFANRGPIIRQSRFYLDEGAYALRSSMLIVSRGLGSVVIPWRWGADPEAVIIEAKTPK
jgi:predicted MPP superfamily phosphohydrolase